MEVSRNDSFARKSGNRLKVQMPANGGTTCRFMRARSLVPPTVQLGNSGIDPPAQIPQRDIIDAQMAVFGTGCVSDCAAA